MQERFLSAIEEKAKVSVRNTFTAAAERTLHTLFPNSYEFYLLAFEVVDSNGFVVQRLAFPVMPSNIQRSEQAIKSINKTFSGVSVLVNSSFVPFSMSVSGTFGRSIKMKVALTDSQIRDAVSAVRQFSTNGLDVRQFLDFSPDFDTGYGYTKKLQKLISLSDKLDEFGKPHRCIMYNLTFNEVVYVEFTQSNFSQSQQTSRIWDYSFNLQAVSPLKSLGDQVGEKITDLVKGDASTINESVKTTSGAYDDIFLNGLTKGF